MVTHKMRDAISSEKLYDVFAGSYLGYSESRKAYLTSVDDIICETAGNRKRYMDIGAGDGRRSMYIADKVRAEEIVLLDSSETMLSKAREEQRVRKKIASITNYSSIREFDLVTCLWNVLGHIPTRELRQEALLRIQKLLSDGGLLAMDVNNRYNVAQYGLRAVFKNMWNDVCWQPTRGMFPLVLGGCTSQVYIHSPFELTIAAAKCGLKLRRKYYVHYCDGSIRKGFLSGQTLYFFEKA